MPSVSRRRTRFLTGSTIAWLLVACSGQAPEPGRVAGDATVAAASTTAVDIGGAASTGAADDGPRQRATDTESARDAAADASPPAAPIAWRRRVPISTPVTVPATFLGIHAQHWPQGGSPAPTYGFGTVRSHDYFGGKGQAGVLWYGINTAPDVYDWSRLDVWVDTHWRAGRQLVYTLYGTPAWCGTRPGTPDPYGRPGGDSKPRDLGCVSRFVDALVRRYNGGGARRIRYVEIWNEPNFGGLRYWRDTAADLAALGRTVYRAAKAADPGIGVLWPSFVEWYEGAAVWKDNLEYGNASDGQGGTGKDWADGFAFHFYGYTTNPDAMMNAQQSVQMTLQALGRPQWPVFATEIGFGPGWGDSLTQSAQGLLIRRWAALAAAWGNRVAVFYAHESDHLGAPAYNVETAAALDDAHRRLAGRTILEAGLLQDGRVLIVFDDNSTWAI